MQFPPIKKGGAGNSGVNPGGQGVNPGPSGVVGVGNNDNYVKNIKKNPQNNQSSSVKPGVVVSGLGIQGGQIPAEFRQTMKHNNSN